MNTLFRRFIPYVAAALALCTLFIAGCGGGGGAAPTTLAAPVEATITGSVVKGPVDGGVVTVSTLAGTVLGTTTTSPNGTYSLKITTSGDVVIEVQGGTYTDEATGLPVTLNQFKAIVKPTSGAQTVHLTPLTYLAYFYSGNTVAGFNTAIGNIATQFGLGGTNLLTSLPVVSGTSVINDYGRVLRAVSQYVATAQGTTTFSLEQLMGLAGTAGTFNAALQANFATAFTAINPGQTLTFAFNGAGITIGGTGVGGGSGTCGVAISGTVPSPGSGVPIAFSGDYCVSGIAAGSCTSGNSSLTSAIPLGAGAVNVNYSYSATCAANAIPINLVP